MAEPSAASRADLTRQKSASSLGPMEQIILRCTHLTRLRQRQARSPPTSAPSSYSQSDVARETTPIAQSPPLARSSGRESSDEQSPTLATFLRTTSSHSLARSRDKRDAHLRPSARPTLYRYVCTQCTSCLVAVAVRLCASNFCNHRTPNSSPITRDRERTFDFVSCALPSPCLVMLSSTLLLCRSSSLQLTPSDKRTGKSAFDLHHNEAQSPIASEAAPPPEDVSLKPKTKSGPDNCKDQKSSPSSLSLAGKMNFVRDLLQRSDSDLHSMHTLSALSTGSLSLSPVDRSFAVDQSPSATSGSPGQLLRGTMQLPLKSPTETKLSKSKSRSRTALNWPFKKLLKNESSVDSGIVLPSPTKTQRFFGQSLDLLCVDGKLPVPVMVSRFVLGLWS